MKNSHIDQIFSALPYPSVVLAADPPRFTVIDANEAFFALTNTTREDAEMNPFFDIFPEIPDLKNFLVRSLVENWVATAEPSRTQIIKWQFLHKNDMSHFRIRSTLVAVEDGMRIVLTMTSKATPELLRELSSDVTEVRRIEHMEHLERDLLEHITRQNAPVQDVLSKYLLGVERIFPHMRASILGIRNNKMHNWASPSLPDAYIHEIENLEIGPRTGSCGAAAFFREQIIVSDIETDDRWADYRELALSFDLRACWSTPIILSDGSVVATFAFYYDQVKNPGELELQLVDRAVAILKLVFENKKSSELVHDSSLLMSQGQELARFGTWQWEIDSSKLVWSDTLYAIYGLKKGEFVPTFETYHKLIHPDDRKRVCADINRAKDTKGELQYEERIFHSSGEERYLRTWIKAVVAEEGHVSRMIGATIDITDSKKTSEELQASESRLRSLVDSQTNYVIRTDKLGNYTYYNNKYAEDFGWFYDNANFLGVNCMSVIQPYSRAIVIETVRKCLKKPGNVCPVEVQHLKRGGSVRTVYWHFIALADVQGTASEVQCIGIDISEEKQIHDALRSSNERYELLNKATNDAIYDWDLISDHIQWGEGFNRVFGFAAGTEAYSLEEWVENIHPSDRERIEEALKARMADKSEFRWSADYQLKRPDGNYVFVEEIGHIRRSKTGRPVRMIGVLRDVTRRKEEEHDLKLLSSVITNTNDAVMIAASKDSDLDGLKILYVNSAFTQITGYQASEVIGQSPLMLTGFLDDRNDLAALKEAIIEVKAVKLKTFCYRRKQEEMFINISVHPVTNEMNELNHWVSIGRDVTEKRKYVDEIEARNKKLEEIAWMQSHVLRAPLARMLGLLDLMQNYPSSDEELAQYLNHMTVSARELDEIVRQISSKAAHV